MSSTLAAPTSTGITGQPVSTRVTSIDIFRGFTMAVMIFVNDLGEVKGLSRWTYHIPRDINAMSYVDMVYPFFLFAVGLSLPLATAQRLRRDPSIPRLWLHILLRAFALVVLGLILANAQGGDPALIHLNRNLWALLAIAGAVLLWAIYPRSATPPLTRTLRSFGAALLALMFVLYRRTDTAGHIRWIDFSYPEILGLIGLTYLGVCLLYIPFRKYRFAPLAWLLVLVLFNIACLAHWTTIDQTPMYLFPWNNGAMPAITMAGVLVSGIFLGDSAPRTPRRKLGLSLCLAVCCLLLGYLLVPLGISKIRATPTWTLWSISAATVIFSLFYWLCDLRRHTRWAALLRPAGSNTLLTYLLPDIVYFALSWQHLNYIFTRWNVGWPGVTRSVCFTLAILLLSLVLTRRKVRLQL